MLFLPLARKALEAYAKEYDIPHVEDETNGEVSCGCDFWVEQQNDGQWVSLGNDFDWTAEGYTLTGHTEAFVLNWEHMYGTLPEGTYRVGKLIHSRLEAGKPIDQRYYTEPFTIE